MKNIKIIGILFILLFCNNTFAQNLSQNQIYKAYTKTYGYVRFFHPSDEVLNLKNNKFAYYGVQKLQNITTIQALKDSLTQIFKPIAPSIKFYIKGENVSHQKIANPKDSLQLVFWQHRGLGHNNVYDQAQEIYKSVRINTWKDTIFGQYPKYGELIETEIYPNLFCKIPLTLYKDKIGTLPRTNINTYNQVKVSLETIISDSLSGNDMMLRMADVAIYWNILKYFYPYFKEVGLDWDNELDNLIADALIPQIDALFWKVLQKYSAKLQDAHTWVSFPKIAENEGLLPFTALWIDKKYLITGSNSPTFKVGDEIISMGNKDIKQVYDNALQYAGGSDYRKKTAFLYHLVSGRINTSKKITLKRNVKGKISIIDTVAIYSADYVSAKPKPSREIEKGIFYLNLTTDSLEYLKTFLPKLQKAKGIIIEMRGYPNGENIDFLGYLSPIHLQTAKWNVPQIIYPTNHIQYDTAGGWAIAPQQPQISCKKVFLTNASAQSYAETFMGIVEHYKLGEIIGQPTAGCNGNIMGFPLLGGYWFGFTGTKVLKHDGSQHHLIGIKPTILITYSEKDILEGRDLEMVKALEMLKK